MQRCKSFTTKNCDIPDILTVNIEKPKGDTGLKLLNTYREGIVFS